MAFAEIAWSAAAQDDAEQRIHQIGRARAATARYLLGDGTADELVLDVVARRRVSAGPLHESVLVEVGAEIAKMTTTAPATSNVVKLGEAKRVG